jgi:hypothetical protein
MYISIEMIITFVSVFVAFHVGKYFGLREGYNDGLDDGSVAAARAVFNLVRKEYGVNLSNADIETMISTIEVRLGKNGDVIK